MRTIFLASQESIKHNGILVHHLISDANNNLALRSQMKEFQNPSKGQRDYCYFCKHRSRTKWQKKKANNAFCRSFGLLKEKLLPHITINYVSNYQESFVITDIKVDPGEMTKLIFCEAGVLKAVKGNWKLAFYLTLAIKLKKEFQKSQNYIRVGRFCTQNDDIIFEPSVKSDSKDFQTRVAGSGNIIRHFILALMQG